MFICLLSIVNCQLSIIWVGTAGPDPVTPTVYDRRPLTTNSLGFPRLTHIYLVSEIRSVTETNDEEYPHLTEIS